MIFSIILSLIGCESSEEELVKEQPVVTEKQAEKPKVDAPVPLQEPLVGGPFPSLLSTQAWFWKDGTGKSKPGPARLDIWRMKPDGWERVRVEDGDSNVFHKAIPYNDGVLTIGAEKANLKHWTFKDGKWNAELLWTKEWGGKFNRLRDIEIADVDGDGKEELIIATHDSGVIAVVDPAEAGSKQTVIELDQRADTFVHEIEVGDINGDGKNEFFATPSDRNQSKKSQPGKVVMYRWDGSSYKLTVVEEYHKTHAKEILVANVDDSKEDELFSVLEAERVGKVIIQPVQIRQHIEKDGAFTAKTIATLDDEQCRFLVPGDFDQDGQVELVAAGYKSGLWLLDQVDGKWETILIDKDSSGFEHTSYGADLDKDGKMELYVAADIQGALNQYKWNATTKKFDKTKIGDIASSTFTWNIVAAEL